MMDKFWEALVLKVLPVCAAICFVLAIIVLVEIIIKNFPFC